MSKLLRRPGGGPSPGRRESAGLHFRRLWMALGFTLIAVVVYLSIMHDPPQIPGDSENWAGHALAYGSMMGWFARLYAGSRLRRRCALALAFCTMGVVLEFVQGATSYRTYDPHDMIANSVGVLIGWLASPPRMPDGIREIDRWLARRLEPR